MGGLLGRFACVCVGRRLTMGGGDGGDSFAWSKFQDCALGPIRLVCGGAEKRSDDEPTPTPSSNTDVCSLLQWLRKMEERTHHHLSIFTVLHSFHCCNHGGEAVTCTGALDKSVPVLVCVWRAPFEEVCNGRMSDPLQELLPSAHRDRGVEGAVSR